MAYYSNKVETKVKGGMPIVARGTVESDETGTSVTDIRLYWASTEKPVTDKFSASLTESDWDAIVEALAE